MKPEITFDEFDEIHGKLEIRVGQIMAAESVPKSNGLKLTVVFGENEDDTKTSFTNLGKHFKSEEFIGLVCPFIMNLVPSVIKGVNSQVMIMVAEDENGKIDLDNYSIGSKLM